jgi:hypothetical protein
MKILNILFILVFTASSTVWSQESSQNFQYIAHNRALEKVHENNKTVVRLSEGPGPGIAWIKDLEFSEGTIEFDAKGRDVLQKSFLGIAFHGIDNETYETVYFRPFNFQAADPVRKIHAVQYSFEPKFGFQQLRNTQKDKYESAIKPSDIQPAEWFHVKIEVKGSSVKAYLNEHTEPCLDIITLNPNPTGKKIGFWVGNSSNGDFANFKVTR